MNHKAVQVSVRITRPVDTQDRGNYLTISAERAAFRRSYRPLATISVIPETLTLDRRGYVKFRSGAGVTTDIYENGYAEVFGSRGVGRHERVDREPLFIPEDTSQIERLYAMLPS